MATMPPWKTCITVRKRKLPMNDDTSRMTCEQIIEKLTENKRDDNKRDDLAGAIDGQLEDYEADLDAMTEEQLAHEYKGIFGSVIQVVAQETSSE